MGAELLELQTHCFAFLGAPLRKWHGEARVSHPMPATYQCRQESAGNLVLALRAGLECGQAFAQAIVAALVVARLEMQTRLQLGRSPVAPVQRFFVAQEEGARIEQEYKTLKDILSRYSHSERRAWKEKKYSFQSNLYFQEWLYMNRYM